jgi:DNA polymerase
MPILYRDYETHSALVITEVGAHRYAAHPTTGVWCCAYAVNDGPMQLWRRDDPAVPPDFIEAARNPDWIVVAHNDQFERLIETHIMAPRYGWPLAPLERHCCTMAMARAMALPGGLKKVAKALKLEHEKHNDKIMKKLAQRQNGEASAEELEALYAYCRQDVEVERELHQRLAPLSPAEQELWVLDQRINDHGFFTDNALINGALAIADAAEAEIKRELAEITGGAITSVDQRDRIVEFLAQLGCDIEGLDKKIVSAALRRKNLEPRARRLLEIRKGGAHAAAAKPRAMCDWRGEDGRIRGAFQFHGASTGRWTSLGVQVQNLKKPEITNLGAAIEIIASGDYERMQQTYPEPLAVVGDVARAFICAAPGHKLVCADLSGIESRVCAWLSGQRSKLELWRTFDRARDPTDDPYLILGLRLGLSPEKARAGGKIADLAFGFSGGIGAWKNIAPEDDASTDAEIKQKQQAWRDQHPETVKYWWWLDRSAIKAIEVPGQVIRCNRIAFEYDGTHLYMHLPSGRRLTYPFARLMIGERGTPVVTFKEANKWVECRNGRGAYGGLWMENAVQAVARDLFAAAMPRLEATGYKIVFHVHDEIAAEVPIEFGTVEEFEQLMVELPDWASSLPLAAKARNGQRFAKIEAPSSEDPPAEDPPQEPRAESAKPNGHADEKAERVFRDDYTAENRREHNGPSWQEAAYIYRLVNGEPYLRVVKKRASNGKKWFFQQHRENGAWVDGAPKPRIPYHLPELVGAPSDAPIWICEGEKDAETVAALELVATTNPEGAGNWRPELSKWFTSRRTVYVLEDNDEVGRAHAIKVAAALAGIVPEIKIIGFRELAEHGDVSDWLAQGHTHEELVERAEKAPTVEPSALSWLDIRAWDHQEVPRQEWAVPERFPLRQTVILSGEGGEGKSLIILQQAAAHVLGREWLEVPVEQGPALFVDAEDDERVLHYRLAAIAEHYGVTFGALADGGLYLISLVGEDAVLASPSLRSGIIEPTALYAQLLEMAGDLKPKMIGIASSADVFAGSEVDRSQVRQFIRMLTRIAIVANGVVVLISHPSLAGIASGSGLSGSTQWHNSVRARAVMKSVKPSDGEPVDAGLRQIEFRKSNYGPTAATIFVRYQGGLFLPVPMSSMDEAARAQQAEGMFLTLLARFASQNQEASPVKGRNYAPTLFARHPDAGGFTLRDFRDAMQRLLDAGRIKIETVGSPSRERKRLVRVD